MNKCFRRAALKMIVMPKMRRWSRHEKEDRARLQEAKNNERCYLLELPTEILLEIASWLHVLDESAFALTCRRVYAISGAILDSKCLQFNRDFAPLYYHYRNTHNFISPRWKFVTLLQDSKWRACSKCLKLHPRTAFTPKELKRDADYRVCNLGEGAGVVDLCPCKKLTFRDKMDLVDLLKVRQKSAAALTMQYGGRMNDRFCWHSCSENYGATQLKVEIFPEMDADDNLQIQTYYQLTTKAGQLAKEGYTTPRFGCAHRSLDLWLSSVCQTTICRLYDNFCASCKRISVCNACNATLKCPRKQPVASKPSDQVNYFFVTNRCLGGPSSVPDAAWAAQRIHPAEPTISSENCSELCPWAIREHPPTGPPPALGSEIIDSATGDQSLMQLFTSILSI